MNTNLVALVAIATIVVGGTTADASGHGPVFGAATPTLGRGGWSIDQAWTLREGDDDERQQMLKTMLSFGVTENLQLSGSFPIAMGDGHLAPARMMSAMSSDREFEGVVGISVPAATNRDRRSSGKHRLSRRHSAARIEAK